MSQTLETINMSTMGIIKVSIIIAAAYVLVTGLYVTGYAHVLCLLVPGSAGDTIETAKRTTQAPTGEDAEAQPLIPTADDDS